jgi:uncharacterized protein
VKLDGMVTIEAAQEKVWAAVTDPNLVSQCAPGLKSMEIIQPDKEFKVVVGIGFGAVMVTFDVIVEFLELTGPGYASLKAHGTAPGSAVDVMSEMRLTKVDENKTDLAWTADVSIVGSIASLASRLMGGITKKMSGAFFDCLKEKIEEKSNVKV